MKLSAIVIMMSALFAACASEPGSNKSVSQNTITPQQMAIERGHNLFQANCVPCHNPIKDATGPAMRGVISRWNGDTARLKAFISNPSAMIAAKDPYVLKLYEQWKPTVMTSFPLPKGDMDALITYLQSSEVRN